MRSVSLEQLTREELRGMTPAAIDAAHRRGQFSELLAGRDPGTHDAELADAVRPSETAPRRGSADQGARQTETAGQIVDVSAIRSMTPEQIVKAHDEGRFDSLLGVKRRAR
ncbi:MAG: hypothetical protein ACKVUT_07265 [Gaiella sp.]